VAGYAMRSFPFDRVYGEGGLHSSKLFDDCVAPLVDGLFEGYNATVLAYGQTGAGKTFTIGTHPKGAEGDRQWPAVIPQFTDMMFAKAAALAQDGRASATATVSFLELYQNSIHDMLADNHKTSHVEIRERGGTQVEVEGQREVAVASAAEVDTCLQRGIAARATHATNMNDHSSRSHAIFTVTLQVKRWRVLQLGGGECHSEEGNGLGGGGPKEGEEEEEVEEVLVAKMHIVDLAGSERIKKSGVEGQQQKEAACINLGLLSLRNCIEALCTPNRSHIPYRSNKLTRLLQDSLGGNARTMMIACVSPADSSMEETLNTLKYTSSARNIKNKVVANRDEQSSVGLAMMDEIHMLREQLTALKSSVEGNMLGGSGGGGGGGDSLELDTLRGERNSWRMRATVAESRCAFLHKEVVALKQEASTVPAGLPSSDLLMFGRQSEGGTNPLFASGEVAAGLPVLGGHGDLSDASTSGSPLPASASWADMAGQGSPDYCMGSSGASAGASPLRLAAEGAVPSQSATSVTSSLDDSVHLQARRLSTNMLFDNSGLDIPGGIDASADGGDGGHVRRELQWLPGLQRAKLEHEHQVLRRKREVATMFQARLEGIQGSVLRSNDGKLEPPVSKQAVSSWVETALCLDSQIAELKQILDAKMATRAAYAHELRAIQQHMQVLENQGSTEGKATDTAELERLGSRSLELQDSLYHHNKGIVDIQVLRHSLQEALSEETDDEIAKRRFQWVAPTDYMCVMSCLYNITRKQREQLLDLRADNTQLRDELAWRNTVMEIFASELDDARASETQLRDELHRAASEKVRVLDLLGEMQQEKADAEEAFDQERQGYEALKRSHEEAVARLADERVASATARKALAQLQEATSACMGDASPWELPAGNDGQEPPPLDDYVAPEGHSLIHDDVLETLERAAIEKTRLAQQLGEKEALLFHLSKRIPKVDSVKAQWEASHKPVRSRGLPCMLCVYGMCVGGRPEAGQKQ